MFCRREERSREHRKSRLKQQNSTETVESAASAMAAEDEDITNLAQGDDDEANHASSKQETRQDSNHYH